MCAVCGRWRDLSAAAFFATQLDLEYRRRWDKSVHELWTLGAHEPTSTELIAWRARYPVKLRSAVLYSVYCSLALLSPMLNEEIEVLVGSYSPVFVSLLLQFPMRIREYVYSRRCAVRTPLTIDGLKLFSCFYSVFYCTVLIVLQCTVLIYFIYEYSTWL